jgi:organic radical activating enzyme
VNINNLGIELTRRCNIRCDHCLRGGAQAKDINLRYVRKLLNMQNVDSVDCLVLSGGEPSLVPHLIRELGMMLFHLDVSIDHFYLATNGTHVTDEFIDAVQSVANQCDAPEYSSIEISRDVYHKRETDHDKVFGGLYKLENAFSDVNIRIRDDDRDPYNVIAQGRAKKNQLSSKQPDNPRVEICDIGISGCMYLNVEGWVIDGGDWSYSEQKKHRLFHVDQGFDILDLLPGEEDLLCA